MIKQYTANVSGVNSTKPYTISPHYNDTRYNDKIRYFTRTETLSQEVMYSEVEIMQEHYYLILQAKYVLDICQNRLTETILTIIQNMRSMKKQE